MKQFIFLFLIFPFVIFAQNSNGYFDISKDAFYYEKMTSWKKSAYKDIDCEFSTLIDNDSVFSFSAQNHFFRERYQLIISNQKKIKKVEIFFTVHNGKLEDWFPYKYPIKIEDAFKDIGNPSLTKENISYTPIYETGATDYKFKKYYKWDNALYKETKSILEVSIGNVKVPIVNERGKIKNYETVDFGYIAFTPKDNGTITEVDINFTTASKIAKGYKKIWLKNKDELNDLLGLERYDISNAWVDEESLPLFFFLKNTNNPKEYYTSLLVLANTVYNIDFIFLIQPEQKFTYTTLLDGVLARAEGMNKDCCIEILIDLENWNKSSYIEKLFIMYHELGHDIFNLEHSDGIRLMATNKLDIEDPSILGEMIHEMFLAILKKQKKK